jgi:hypothetical protein
VFLTQPEFNSDQIGDLDNFVSGVCDALQAANTQPQHLHASFQLPQNQDVDPSLAIAIVNDLAVVSIVADRFQANADDSSHYIVIIDGD